MKKVGIIGGAGPYASALFYETMIEESYLQSEVVPEILLLNYSFTRGLTEEEGVRNEQQLLGELHYCVQTLERHRVQIGVLACNTLHLYMRKLPQSGVVFLSLPDAVMRQAREEGHHRLLILATQNTCRSGLYFDPKMTAIYPMAQEQSLVDQVIDHVLAGDLRYSDSDALAQVIEKTAERFDFDGVVLGCTDLPVLHHRFPIQSVKPLFDSIKIPAKMLRRMI